jgi:hypothetical protein
MKKTEIIVVLLFAVTQPLMAQSDDDAIAKMVASGVAAAVFYGIIAIVRGFKAKCNSPLNTLTKV